MAKKELTECELKARKAKNVGRAQGAAVAAIALAVGAVALNKVAKKNVVTIGTNGVDKTVKFVSDKVKGKKAKKAAAKAE